MLPASGCSVGPAGGNVIRDAKQGANPATEQEYRPQESDGWRILSYMFGGMILYGGIGWLVGRWTGITVLFPIGMILGIGLSIALIIFRVTRR